MSLFIFCIIDIRNVLKITKHVKTYHIEIMIYGIIPSLNLICEKSRCGKNCDVRVISLKPKITNEQNRLTCICSKSLNKNITTSNNLKTCVLPIVDIQIER